MTGFLAGVFLTGIDPLSGGQRMALILPLCLSIAVVYKTLRCREMREIPMAALILWGTVVLGMYAVAVGMWVLFTLTV